MTDKAPDQQALRQLAAVALNAKLGSLLTCDSVTGTLHSLAADPLPLKSETRETHAMRCTPGLAVFLSRG
jgi:hypothetical protein